MRYCHSWTPVTSWPSSCCTAVVLVMKWSLSSLPDLSFTAVGALSHWTWSSWIQVVQSVYLTWCLSPVWISPVWRRPQGRSFKDHFQGLHLVPQSGWLNWTQAPLTSSCSSSSSPPLCIHSFWLFSLFVWVQIGRLRNSDCCFVKSKAVILMFGLRVSLLCHICFLLLLWLSFSVTLHISPSGCSTWNKRTLPSAFWQVVIIYGQQPLWNTSSLLINNMDIKMRIAKTTRWKVVVAAMIN